MGEQSGVDRCPATFAFGGMSTVFDCMNRPDVPVKGANPNRPAWSHLHGRWHYFEDKDADGVTYRVEWGDADADPSGESS